MLVWLDLETTGLTPSIDRILEVAAIVTTDDFEEVDRFHRIVYWLHSAEDIAKLHPAVQEMHTKSGLFDDVVSDAALQPFEADEALARFIQAWAHTVEVLVGEDGVPKPRIIKPQIAGSTISFDREFMRYWLPQSLDMLHYRNVDVSTLNELARRFWPSMYKERPNNETKVHRGMADIEESIRVCKYYVSRLCDGNVVGW